MSSTKLPEGVLPNHRGLYYGGAWHAPLAGQYVNSVAPATAEAIAEASIAEADDVDAAVRAAHAAFDTWRRTDAGRTGRAPSPAAEVLREHADSLALLDALDTGSPVTNAGRDARFAAASLDYFAGLATEIKGDTLPMGNGHLNYTLREPLGVVARIVAYNHPLMFAAMRIAAPLAAGNTVVVKAPDQAPLSLLRLAELIGELFPPGVVNFLTRP